ncbi:MAG: hypothetical protein WD065_04440 [Planctomycetaceae bacterium]
MKKRPDVYCPGRYRPQKRRARGLSLVEVAVSTLLVGLTMITAMTCLGNVITGGQSTADLARAKLLARQLLDEIMEENYADGGLLPLFGPELGESLITLGPRSGWDDVDDYHLYTESPPKDRSGATLPNCTGWRRDVAVEFVNPSNPANTSLTDLGVKRVTVTVRRNSVAIATLVGLRSKKYTAP